ncbi:hypothetical protein SAMN05444166_8126 [Singulisphaera sp. GP187]|nr:hypothetical protein SAMN05444166_8126 [Singulisphaera sp. GP187]
MPARSTSTDPVANSRPPPADRFANAPPVAARAPTSGLSRSRRGRSRPSPPVNKTRSLRSGDQQGRPQMGISRSTRSTDELAGKVERASPNARVSPPLLSLSKSRQRPAMWYRPSPSRQGEQLRSSNPCSPLAESSEIRPVSVSRRRGVSGWSENQLALIPRYRGWAGYRGERSGPDTSVDRPRTMATTTIPATNQRNGKWRGTGANNTLF